MIGKMIIRYPGSKAYIYPQAKWHYIEIDKMRSLAYNSKTKEAIRKTAKELLIMNYKPKIVRRLI